MKTLKILTAFILLTLGGLGYISWQQESRIDTIEDWDPTVIEKTIINEVSEEIVVGADAQKFIGGFPYTIAGGGITSSQTTITVTSFTLPQNDYPIQDSDVSDTFYITIEPGNTTRQEFASCTTVGTNTGSNVTFSGCTRGLSPISPYTASSSLQFSHAGGTKLIFSNPPQLYDQAVFKNNDESITGIYTFSSSNPPRYSATPVLTGNGLYLASVAYVNALANQGASTSSEPTAGIVRLATQLQMASSTNLGANDPLVLQAKNATSTCQVIGLYVPVTANNGKIAPSCISLTSTYNWTGTHTWSGSLTFSGNTSHTATTTVKGIIYNQGNNTLGLSTTTVFSLAGSHTWTKPLNARRILVEIWGAGGGGGSATEVGGDSYGGGGGGGAYVSFEYQASDVSATQTVTIGAGGSAGTAGGNTTFGSLLTAYGGGGGFTSTDDTSVGGGGGGGALGIGVDGSGTAEGDGGRPYLDSDDLSTSMGGSYGGGFGALSGAVSMGGDSNHGGAGGGANGVGGASVFGGGAGGSCTGNAGGTSLFGGAGGAGNTNATASNGTAPAGGGGGACRTSAGTSTGGSGAVGRARITVFY